MHAFSRDPLADLVDQKRRLAVQRPAAHGRGQMTEQAGRGFRLEDDRRLLRLHLFGTQPPDGPLGCGSADRRGRFEVVQFTLRRIPVVALHGVVLHGDRHDAQGEAGGAVSSAESERIRIHDLAGRIGKLPALGVSNSRIRGQGGLFRLTSQRQLVLRWQGRGLVRQVEVGDVLCQGGWVGQAGDIIRRGHLGETERFLDERQQAGRCEIRGRGDGAPPSVEETQAEPAFLCVVNGFDVSESHAG